MKEKHYIQCKLLNLKTNGISVYWIPFNKDLKPNAFFSVESEDKYYKIIEVYPTKRTKAELDNLGKIKLPSIGS